MTEPTKMVLRQKSWQGWDLWPLAENCAGSPIAAVTPYEMAQAIVVEDSESILFLRAERPRLTAIEPYGPDYSRIDPPLGFA